MKNTFISSVLFCVIFISCEKEKTCWQAFDPAGMDVPGLLICDKSKAEAEAEYPQYWFYNASEDKYCWKLIYQGNTYYTKNVPESMAEKMEANGFSFSKVDCNSFCRWEYHDKRKSKSTGLFGQTTLGQETYFTDSCNTIFVDRVIVLNETTDTIYTRQFVKKIY